MEDATLKFARDYTDARFSPPLGNFRMLEMTFSPADLVKILEQAAIYDCACPAQICKQLGSLRALYDYQAHCLNLTDTDRQVHERIAAATTRAHADMEACLEDVLALEGWDRDTLEMPSYLKKRLIDACSADDSAAD